MRMIMTVSLALIVANATAQTRNETYSYDNTKTLSVGITVQGIGANKLNEILKDNGYGSLQSSVTAITVNVGSTLTDRFGMFYAADFGLVDESPTDAKYKRFQYYRIYGGLEFTAYSEQHLTILARLAPSYSTASLRLYDNRADSNFSKYISGTPDAKRMTAGTFGIDAGFQARVRPGQHTVLSFGGGYVMSFSNSEWHHDAVSLNDAPNIQLGSWYVGVRVGVLFHRQITHIIDGLDSKDKKEDATPVYTSL